MLRLHRDEGRLRRASTAQYSLSRWSNRVNTSPVLAASVAETGLDLGTLRFSASGSVARSYGAAWVREWNRSVTTQGIGRPANRDTDAVHR